MSTKYPQGIITPTPPYKSTTAKSFSGVWTLEQLANNFYYYKQAISKSLRFRSSASAYLNRTPASAGNRTTWTYSVWHKRGQLGASYAWLMNAYSATQDALDFSADRLDFWLADAVSIRLTSTAVYRDPSAWYHIVLAFDSTQATASNRIKMYVNGVQLTSFSTANYPSQNYQCPNINNTVQNEIGYVGGSTDGYMAEINFIDGQALDPSYFGQISPITGVWSPAPYTGAYGTNGFYLKFSDTTSTTTLCYDYSGNSNNWTPNNISLTAGSTYDSMLDSPTNYDNGGTGVGNYAVLNPLYAYSSLTLSGANLNIASSANYRSGMASFGVSSGKWYWEYVVTAVGNDTILGISSNPSVTIASYPGNDALSWGYEAQVGNKYNNGSFSAYGATYTTNDVIGIAFDADAGSLTFYKNGVSQGVAYSGLASGTYYAAFGLGTSSTGSANFGQRPFSYTPPTGYKALNTQNLPAPSIQNGSNFMAATLYTGTGASQSIVNANNSVSFQPDLVWAKGRSVAGNNILVDSVRGVNNYLVSDTTAAEAVTTGLAFTSTGFTWNNGISVNGSGYTYVNWQWKAGGTAVTNTAGSITSSVSANTTAGFSVVTYSGNSTTSATVGHGLGVAPSMILIKSRSASQDWGVYHVSGALKLLQLNTTNAWWNSGANYWYAVPTASAFYPDNTYGDHYQNTTGQNYVAYCFAAIPGYSAFGSYTGNGSNDGPFVYCGFRPRYVMYKNASVGSAGYDWVIIDSSRSTYNIAVALLDANLSAAENTNANAIDILSNGFKLRDLGAAGNGSGNTIIYAAFAENPFNYSLAR